MTKRSAEPLCDANIHHTFVTHVLSEVVELHAISQMSNSLECTGPPHLDSENRPRPDKNLESFLQENTRLKRNISQSITPRAELDL